MTSLTGSTVVLLTILLTHFVAQGVINIKDIAHSPCRIAGVLLAESSDHKYKFNFTRAESVCHVLGLQLASKNQVEKANKYGFETCSFGWVSEQFVVISRIQPNEKCGQSKTGLVPWMTVNAAKDFHAYCFNASDTRKNSCKPDPLTTIIPDTSKAPSSTAESVQPGAYDTTTKAFDTTPKAFDTTPKAFDTTPKAFDTTPKANDTTPKIITILNAITTTRGYVKMTTFRPTFTTTQITTTFVNDLLKESTNKPQAVNAKESFGGLPAALLTLALVFFIAFVVLAVCYIKQYKTNWFFPKNEEKESVETKVFKENTNAEQESSKEEGQKANGKSEIPQAGTGNSMEAEV
ncbi:hypothetical protein XENTR_v10010615 [Xenopus tropicalis]|nr:lymphatic vessel endothelial hyaluronic acid receptor 1 [Xenopus tropicalis]KAE8606157.1 hypothetical protein XENTR_v10010615 [Xenopus tropicalis]|eukprot:XP_002942315.2 PREDICTED: lymphatic vessel endothelial hyaluronic acid receptor 1 [Xenopus tropicalis]